MSFYDAPPGPRHLALRGAGPPPPPAGEAENSQGRAPRGQRGEGNMSYYVAGSGHDRYD